MYSNILTVNFEFGEVSPIIRGRHDLKVGQNGLEICRNFIVTPQGPVKYRTGTRFVKYTRGNQAATFIPFQFNDQQSYLIEATNQKFRFYKDEGVITEAAKNITTFTNANPGVVTSAGHGYADGDEVYIDGVVGMSGVNGRFYLVANASTDTFEITDVFGTNVNTTASGAYTSGGTVARVYEIATPYTTAHLPEIQFAQNADTMYLTHQSYKPKKLSRTGHTSWTLADFTPTADPFTSAGNYPRAVAFTPDARLLMGGTANKPETFWASKQPDSSGARFNDFTTGTASTDGLQFTLAPLQGKVDSIMWFTNTDKFLVCGTYGTVRRVYGASEEEPISSVSISAKTVNKYGCALIAPVTIGTTVFYIERGATKLRSFEYDYRIDGYVSVDRVLISEHLTRCGVVQLAFQAGTPNILWAVRSDGVLLGLTYEDKEDKAGWHRHYLGGKGAVLSIGIMPRDNNVEQLWAIVQRNIDGHTVRCVEFFTDSVSYPRAEDFYSLGNSEVEDKTLYENALSELQKQQVHLDAALTYDGASYGEAASAALTLSATTGSITITASASVFTASMVGRQIWKIYDTVTGEGGGRAEITAYTSATQVSATVLQDFDTTSTIAAGDWYLTTDTINGAWHLEGETVQVVVDGAVHPERTVEDGAFDLTQHASVVHVGFGYTGVVKSLNLEQGGVSGVAQTKYRNVNKLGLRFLDTNAAKVGTDLYDMSTLQFRADGQITDRAITLFSGVTYQTLIDTWGAPKHVYVLQDSPAPCTLLGMDVYAETTDE